MKGEFLRKQGSRGFFATQDDKSPDVWWYYTWGADGGTPTTYQKGITTLPQGGTWFKGSQPPKEDVIEEQEEEATIDDAGVAEEVGTEDTAADAADGGDAGDAGDGGGDGGGE